MDVITIVRYQLPNGEWHVYYQHNPALSMQTIKALLQDVVGYVDIDMAEEQKAKEGSESAGDDA